MFPCLHDNKAFQRVETLFVQGRNLYLAGVLLVKQNLFTFCQLIVGLQSTDFYLGRIKFLHVERPINSNISLMKYDPHHRPGQQSNPIGQNLINLNISLMKYDLNDCPGN